MTKNANDYMQRNLLLLVVLLTAMVGMVAGDGVKDVTPAQAQKMIKKGGHQVVDVRTPNEYRAGHLVNAVLVDYYDSAFMDNLKNLDKEKPVIVYCARGGRSADATKKMVDAGFKKVYNVLGGFNRWSAESLPSVR